MRASKLPDDGRGSILPQTIVASGATDVLEKMDFSKPDRYIREMLDFLSSVTIHSLNFKNKGLKQSDAQMLIFTLIQLMAPNFRKPPTFKAQEI